MCFNVTNYYVLSHLGALLQHVAKIATLRGSVLLHVAVIAQHRLRIRTALHYSVVTVLELGHLPQTSRQVVLRGLLDLRVVPASFSERIESNNNRTAFLECLLLMFTTDLRACRH